MIKFFVYDRQNNNITVNQPEVLLVKEFADLWTNERNKCPEDPSGEKRLKAFRELTYIYMAIDWGAPGSKDTPANRHKYALEASQLTDDEYNDPLFREACRKYRSLQDSNKSIKLLNAARNAADQFVDYFETIIDLNERDQNGKPVFSAEKVMKEMAQLSKVHEQLVALEAQVKQELEVQAGTRANVDEGFDPGNF